MAGNAFRKGSPWITLRDELGAIYEDADFAALFPPDGRPAEAPWRLALVTCFQFAEGLSDSQAADAVRSRIDWKYALSLPLDLPGFDDSVFSIRSLNHLENVARTFQHALNTVATVAPDWMRAHLEAEWGDWPEPQAGILQLTQEVPYAESVSRSCTRPANSKSLTEKARKAVKMATLNRLFSPMSRPLILNHSQRDDFNVSDALFAHQTASCWRRGLSDRIGELIRISICL